MNAVPDRGGKNREFVPSSSPVGKRKSGVETFLLSMGVHPVVAAGGHLPSSTPTKVAGPKRSVPTKMIKRNYSGENKNNG